MLILSIIIDIMIIMSKYEQAELTYQEQVKRDFSEALKKESLDWLDGLIDGLVKFYKKMPKLEDQSIYNKKSGETFKTMQKLKNQTICQSLEEEKRRQFGIESLKIFNLKNSNGQTAVMIAAKYGRADLLKKWYYISDDLTGGNYYSEELQEVYNQRVSSYVAQDNEGRNALMYAVLHGKANCIKDLLSPETAITLNQKNNAGKTAFRYAIESGECELIQEFIFVAKKALSDVNLYDPKSKIKLEIDDDTSESIQSIKNKEIKSLIINFLDESREHIVMPCSMPLSLLKRKSNEANNKRKGENKITDKMTQKAIRVVTEFDYKTKSFTGPFSKKLDRFKEYVNFIQLASDYERKTHPTLEKLKEKCQEVGQFLLKKLLYEVNSYSYNLTSDQKEKVLGCINNLVTKAEIEFPEDQIQNIPNNIINEVLDILNAPNPQLHSTTSSLASGSSLQR